MKTLTFAVFATILTLSAAFGQKGAEKLTGTAAAQAWAATSNAANVSIPALAGAAIVTVPQINDYGANFSAILSITGNFLLQGTTCEGDTVRLGSWRVEVEKGQTATIPIVNTDALNRAAPGLPNFCQVAIFKVDSGISGLTVNTNPERQSFGIIGDSFTNKGEYYVVLTGVSKDAAIALGNFLMASRIERAPTGETLVFFNRDQVSPTRLTTITVCQDGNCQTQVWQRTDAVLGVGGKG